MVELGHYYMLHKGVEVFVVGVALPCVKVIKLHFFILRLTVVVVLQTSNIITAVVAVLLETLY